MDAPTTPVAPQHDEEARSAFRPNRLTSGIVAGGAAFAMVHAGLGIASAQTEGATTSDPPAASTEGDQPRSHRHHRGGARASLGTVASTLGLDIEALKTQLREGKSIATIAGDRADEVVAAVVAEKTERIDAAVAEGRLTQAEADERKAGLQERVTTMVNRTPPPEGERGPKPGGRGAGLSVAASALGMTEEALRAELQSGKSLAAVAGDKTPALIDALVADATARIDQAATDGKLTAEQAAERKANLTDHITARVNAVRPAGEGPRGGHHHGPRPAPAGGEAEAAPASVDA
jgi:ribosomal protein S20